MIEKYQPQIEEKRQKLESHNSGISKLGDIGTCEPNHSSKQPTVWLNFIGSTKMGIRRSESKETAASAFERCKDIKFVCFSEGKKPSGIRAGDVIYTAKLGIDKNGNRRAFIIARSIAVGFDPAQSNRDIAMSIQKTQWPIYLELRDLKIFNGHIDDAMPTTELWPHEGKPVDNTPQGSHIRITQQEAIQFLEDYSSMFETSI